MAYTLAQRRKIAELYRLLASWLPVEGRDYKLEINFSGPEQKLHIKMSGTTLIGKLWSEYCINRLSRLNEDNGYQNTTNAQADICVDTNQTDQSKPTTVI